MRSFLLIAALGLGACSDDVERGKLGAQPSVVVPARASVNVSFVVNVTTYAYCAAFDSTEVTMHDDEALIEPFDTPPGDGPCPKIIVNIPHDASIVFRSPGTKTIWVRGLGDQDELRSLSYSVLVE